MKKPVTSAVSPGPKRKIGALPRVTIYFDAAEPEELAALRWAERAWRGHRCADPAHGRPRGIPSLMKDIILHAHSRARAKKNA